MEHVIAIVQALYCERGRPSGTKMAAVAATAVALWSIMLTVQAGGTPDWTGLSVFLGVPWGVLVGRKKVEPLVPPS